MPPIGGEKRDAQPRVSLSNERRQGQHEETGRTLVLSLPAPEEGCVLLEALFKQEQVLERRLLGWRREPLLATDRGRGRACTTDGSHLSLTHSLCERMDRSEEGFWRSFWRGDGGVRVGKDLPVAPPNEHPESEANTKHPSAPMGPSTTGRQRSSASFALPSSSLARSSSQSSLGKGPSTQAPAAARQPSPSSSLKPRQQQQTDIDDDGDGDYSPPSTGETTSSFQTSSSDESSPYGSAEEGPTPTSTTRRELEIDRAEDAQGFELGSDAEDEAWGGQDEDSALSPFIPAGSSSGGGRRHRAYSTGRAFAHQRRKSTTASSGSLTLFQLTTSMLSLALSPTVLALPYAVYLLSPQLFIPLLCAIASLAGANHIGIVYVARYLGVKRFEDLGRGFGGSKKTRAVLRVSMVLSGIGVMVLYLKSKSPPPFPC